MIDELCEMVEYLVRATGIAWLWNAMVDGVHRVTDPIFRLVRPVVAPLVAPIERWGRQWDAREASANFALAAKLERAGLTDSATKVRDLAAEQLVRSRERR